jgi:hypothetical protein
MKPTPLSTRSSEFDMKEYDALRAEVLDVLGKCFSFGQWVLIACAAIFAWIGTSAIRAVDNQPICLIFPADLMWFLAFIPAGVAILAGLYLFERVSFVQHLGEYIKKIEAAYSGVGGWEHELVIIRSTRKYLPSHFIWLAWIAFTIVNVAGGSLLLLYTLSFRQYGI